jgi:hypothetical protein
MEIKIRARNLGVENFANCGGSFAHPIFTGQ